MRGNAWRGTDLKQGRSPGDGLQTRAAAPLHLSRPQVSVTHHGGGGEGAGVATAGAITGLRGVGEIQRSQGQDGNGDEKKEMERVRMM